MNTLSFKFTQNHINNQDNCLRALALLHESSQVYPCGLLFFV